MEFEKGNSYRLETMGGSYFIEFKVLDIGNRVVNLKVIGSTDSNYIGKSYDLNKDADLFKDKKITLLERCEKITVDQSTMLDIELTDEIKLTDELRGLFIDMALQTKDAEWFNELMKVEVVAE